jgi:hypothetical protein
MAYRRTYKDLRVTSITPEHHAKTCGYWYLVTDSAFSHTAFAHLRSLVQWASERGLTLPELPTERGVYGGGRITGSYSTESHGDMEEFDNLRARSLHSITLSNGDYVRALITDENGHRVVHTLNPNCRERETFDYAKHDERRQAA